MSEGDGMSLIAHADWCPHKDEPADVQPGGYCTTCTGTTRPGESEEDRLRRQLAGAVELLDALDRYVGHVNCGVVHGAPECDCGFDELYTRVRATVRGQ